MGCADRRWENRFEELPQQAATLRLQWRHIGSPSSTTFPSCAALNPKWSQKGNFALLFLTIPFSAIAQKMRKNVRLPLDTLYYLICIRVLMRNMADLTVEAWIREIDFSTELKDLGSGSQDQWPLCHVEKCPFQRWCVVFPEEAKVNDSHTLQMPHS